MGSRPLATVLPAGVLMVVIAACGAAPDVRTEVAERRANDFAGVQSGGLPAAGPGAPDRADPEIDLGQPVDGGRAGDAAAAPSADAGQPDTSRQLQAGSQPSGERPDGAEAAAAGATDTGVGADVIKIGGLYFNGSWLDKYSQVAEQAASAYFRFVNDRGGIHGRRIQFITCDTAATVSGTQGCIRKLVEEDRVFALGPSLDFNLDTVVSYVERANVPWLGSSGLYDQEFASPLIFPTQLAGGDMGAIATTFVAQQLDARTIGVSWNTQPPGPACFERVQAIAPSQGMQVVVDANNGQTEADLSGQVIRIRGANPDVVLMCNDPVNIVKFIQAAGRQGYTPPVGWIGAYTHADDVPQAIGRHGIGFYGLSSFDHYHSDTAGVREYLAILHHYFPRSFPHIYSQAAFAGARATVDALEAAGPELTRERFLAHIGTMTAFDSRMGLVFNFGDRAAQQATGIVFQVNEDLEWRQVTDRFTAVRP